MIYVGQAKRLGMWSTVKAVNAKKSGCERAALLQANGRAVAVYRGHTDPYGQQTAIVQ